MSDDEGRKAIWTDGREQRVCVENDYLDDPTGARGRHVVVLLDEEDYEHQFTADEAREIAAALVKAVASQMSSLRRALPDVSVNADFEVVPNDEPC